MTVFFSQVRWLSVRGQRHAQPPDGWPALHAAHTELNKCGGPRHGTELHKCGGPRHGTGLFRMSVTLGDRRVFDMHMIVAVSL